ncbi:MAG TPA: nitroreductase family protein [Candidatus Nanoarchaeia archaeon]|nr:nitroreductase family protein [Candidatus Nanoarchaeia archaeon]
MDLDKAIKLRKSTKKFSDKKPDWRRIIECIDSTRYAPMAAGNFSLKFILIDDREKIGKISGMCEQRFFSKVHYLVIVCSIPSRTKNAFKEKGEIYLRQQAGAAIENFLLKIQDFGLATCWVGHFIEEEIKRELRILDDVNVEAIFPIGYPQGPEKERSKRKISLDNILYFNEYGNPRMRQPRVPEG